ADVDRQGAVRLRVVEEVREAGAPDDLAGLVGRTGVDRLREGLVDAGEEDQKLRVPILQILMGGSPERALFIDGMDDRPRQGEEDDLGALQLEVDELAVAAAVPLE